MKDGGKGAKGEIKTERESENRGMLSPGARSTSDGAARLTSSRRRMDEEGRELGL